MKIRSGWVSNSSSSSFIIIGKKVPCSEVEGLLDQGVKVFLKTDYYGCEGSLSSFIDKKDFNELQEVLNDDKLEFYQVYKYAGESAIDFEGTFEFEKGTIMFSVEADYHFDVDYLKEMIAEEN